MASVLGRAGAGEVGVVAAVLFDAAADQGTCSAFEVANDAVKGAAGADNVLVQVLELHGPSAWYPIPPGTARTFSLGEKLNGIRKISAKAASGTQKISGGIIACATAPLNRLV